MARRIIININGVDVELSIDFKWENTPDEIKKALGITPDLNLFAANSAYQKMNPYVPMETGTLSQTVNIYKEGKYAFIEYMVPYANANYYGEKRNFSKEQHPLATSFWDKAMMHSKKDELVQEVSKYRKRLVH